MGFSKGEKNMQKFKKKLVGDIKEAHQDRANQEKLRHKYHISKNYVVVEKSNTFKFTISLLLQLIKFLASAIILILAIIGLYTLIYPEIRDPFFKIIYNTFLQIKTML